MIMDPHQNIIQNPKFENGLNNWSGVGCKLVTLKEYYSTAHGKTIDPHHSKTFVVATGREESWNGIMQDITGRVDRHVLYEINAVVRVHNKCSNSNVMSRDADDNMQATLCLQLPDHRQRNITISLVEAAAEEEWIHVQGKFIISSIISPSRVTVTLHGPPPSTDILINSLVIKPAEKCHPSPPPIFTKHHPDYGVNIIQNSDFTNDTNSWYPIGNSTLSIKTDQAKQIPQTSNYSQLIHHQSPDHNQPPSTGTRYMQVTNRTNSQDGVAQNIPVNKLQLFLTYQVSAYVKVVPTTTSGGGSGTKNLLSTTTQRVNATVTVDGKRLKGARVDVASDGSNTNQWCEIVCSFRIEKKKLPSKLGFQVQGPEAGFDLLIASGVAVFAVDRKSRFQLLKTQTDKVRKRDVILKFKAPAGSSSPTTLKGATVNIKQTKNNFPLGTCITRDNLDNKNLITFFLNNFNWSVFGNELKWYHTEPTRSNFNYRDADEMLDFCNKNNIQVRGHCIFWSVESMVQQWIRALNKDELKKAVEDHLTGLLNRYTSKFKHYDVNNEMLHGSFFQDHLGKEIRPYMFTKARELDHNAVLFVNDYNVENGGGDSKATPTKYVDQILGLRAQGVDVGGIGLQGHMDSPVGSVVASALDELWGGTNNTPIWFTELDVTSTNEHVRAEDLEVMLREAYAHPGVGGVVLWGFMEGTMWRQNAYLVNADGEVNEAGKRFIELKKEWTSNVNGGVIGDDNGVFEFKGFYGDYEVEVVLNDGNTVKKSVVKSFVVDKSGIVGNGHVDPLVISIDL